MADPGAARSPSGAVAVVALFALGIVFGVALSFVILHHGGRFSPLRGRHDGAIPLARMTRRLDLDEAQQEKVRAILERAHARMRAVLEDARKEVRAELRPDQQEKLDRMHPLQPKP